MQLPDNLKLGFSVSLALLYFTFRLVYFTFLFILTYLFIITIGFTCSNLFFVFNEFPLNPLLANSLVGIHPPLYLVIFFFSTLFVLLTYLFPNLLTFRVLSLYRLTFIYLFICLFLGCWWAFQETYWGGWWFWEVSELLIIFLIILVLLFLHSVDLLHLFRFFYLALTALTILFIYTKGLDTLFEVTLHSFFSAKGVISWSYLFLTLFLQLPLVFFSKSCCTITFFFLYSIFLVFPTFILGIALVFMFYVFFFLKIYPPFIYCFYFFIFYY